MRGDGWAGQAAGGGEEEWGSANCATGRAGASAPPPLLVWSPSASRGAASSVARKIGLSGRGYYGGLEMGNSNALGGSWGAQEWVKCGVEGASR